MKLKTLSEQLDAARRELAMRRSAYPKWVASGRMTQAKADHEIECMDAIVVTVEKVLMLEQVTQEMLKK